MNHIARNRRRRSRVAAWIATAALLLLGVPASTVLAAGPAHAGLDGPMATEIDQHCLTQPLEFPPGFVIWDYVTVRVESLNGGDGLAWVDYEIPGSWPRTEGPRGSFDPGSRSVAFTFKVSAFLFYNGTAPFRPLRIYTGSIWADGTSHQDEATVTLPPPCGHVPEGQGWSGSTQVSFTQTCQRRGRPDRPRWVNQVSVVLVSSDPFEPQDAWVHYWLSSREDDPVYRRGAQGQFDPGGRMLTLTFEIPSQLSFSELDIVGSVGVGGRSLSAHAWARWKLCGLFTGLPPGPDLVFG